MLVYFNGFCGGLLIVVVVVVVAMVFFFFFFAMGCGLVGFLWLLVMFEFWAWWPVA